MAEPNTKMNSSQLSDQICKFEAYINDVLKSDLNSVCVELDRVTKDLTEYQRLRDTIIMMLKRKENDESYEFTTDIGSNFFARVVVEDMSSILLDIGFGYYLDFTLAEALKFIDTREKFFNSKLIALRDKSAQIKGYVKHLLLTSQELYSTANNVNE